MRTFGVDLLGVFSGWCMAYAHFQGRNQIWHLECSFFIFIKFNAVKAQIKTEKIDLAEFLHRRRVPGFPSPACPCGWYRQTPKHAIMPCSLLPRQRAHVPRSGASATTDCPPESSKPLQSLNGPVLTKPGLPVCWVDLVFVGGTADGSINSSVLFPPPPLFSAVSLPQHTVSQSAHAVAYRAPRAFIPRKVSRGILTELARMGWCHIGV